MCPKVIQILAEEAAMEGPFAPEKMPPFMRGDKVGEWDWFYSLLARVADVLVPIFFSVKIEGLDRVSEDTGFVLTPNHDNAFDPILISYLHYYLCRPIYWLAKIELFGPLRLNVLGRELTISEKHMTRFMYAVRCIPITRDKPEMQSFKSVKAVLLNRGVVGVFPEGTRNRGGKKDTAHELKAGAIKFAQLAKVPVIPALMKSSKPSLRHFRRGTFTVSYGIPIYPTRDQSTEEQLELLRRSMTDLGCFEH
jgi:1-acyl-sn-glycerol-3-phosphate acyltransferase